jgi:3-oxoacyl-[acyl-carrier-protein] synthase III
MGKHWLVMDGDGPTMPFRVRLGGVGRHLPKTHLSTDELMAATRHNTHIDLERLTAIRERRVSARQS